MNRFRHVVAVGSGKGGVGKSTVSLNLAIALAAEGNSVGLVDADIYGPNIPLMAGITRRTWGRNWMLSYANVGDVKPIEPVEAHGVKLVSTAFFTGEDQWVNWRGGMVQLLSAQLVNQVSWGELDFLVVDLPPGAGEVQESLLRGTGVSAAIVVVTPEYVAHLDARKAVSMYRSAGVEVLGAVENMASYICPNCSDEHPLFDPVPEERSVWSMQVDRLLQLPFDSEVAIFGHPPAADPASRRGELFRELALTVSTLLPA